MREIEAHHLDDERNFKNSLDDREQQIRAVLAGRRANDAWNGNPDLERRKEQNPGRKNGLDGHDRKVLGSGVFPKLVVTRLEPDKRQDPLDGLAYQLGAERIQELLDTGVPALLSQKALDGQDFAFSCGGNLTVEFATMKEVAEADDGLRAALPEHDLLRRTGQEMGEDAPLK